MVYRLLAEWCVATSFYQRAANHVSFYPLFNLRNLSYLILCAIRAKQFPEVRNRYLALKKRRGHKKAIIAITRMLLTAIYNILK